MAQLNPEARKLRASQCVPLRPVPTINTFDGSFLPWVGVTRNVCEPLRPVPTLNTFDGSFLPWVDLTRNVCELLYSRRRLIAIIA